MGRLILAIGLFGVVLIGCGSSESAGTDDPAKGVEQRQTERGVPDQIQKQSAVAGGQTK